MEIRTMVSARFREETFQIEVPPMCRFARLRESTEGGWKEATLQQTGQLDDPPRVGEGKVGRRSRSKSRDHAVNRWFPSMMVFREGHLFGSIVF